MTLQTRAPENFRSCRWGDEWKRQACADGERGPPSARAEIQEVFLVLVLFGTPSTKILNLTKSNVLMSKLLFQQTD